MDKSSGSGRILVVDDQSANLDLFIRLLKSSGYEVQAASSGVKALDAARQIRPDLILLDILMPGMDGYKVCQRLKGDPELRDIPVIFVSALGETVDKVKGFDVGAVDYLTKPLEAEEALVRIKTHLALHDLQKHLEEHVEARTAELVAEIAERQRVEQALRKANRAYQALRACNQARAEATEETLLLQEVCQIIQEACEYQLVWVGLVEPGEARTIRRVAQAGSDAGYLDGAVITWTGKQESDGGMLFVDAPADNAGDKPSPEERIRCGYESFVAFPMSPQHEMIGVLSVYSATPDAFESEEVNLLIELANDLAFGIISLRTQAERQGTARALIEERALLRALIDNLPDLIYIKDTEGRFLIANLAVASLMNAIPEELIGKTDFSFFPDNLASLYSRDELSIIKTGQTVLNREEPVLVPDGSTHWLLTTKVPLTDSRGAVKGVIGIGRDITERHRMEQILQERTAELVFANRQLQQEIVERKQAEAALHRSEMAEREQRVLAEALRETMAALTSTLDLASVLQLILKSVGRVVPHDRGNIMLIDGDAAYVTYTHNYPDVFQSFLGTFPFPLTTANLHSMITTGSPFVIADTGTYTDWIHAPATADVHSYVGVPIQSRGRVIGFLNLDSAQPGFFTNAHAEALQVFANQAAIALENAQHFADLRSYAADLEQRVHERTEELNRERAQLQAILESMAEGLVYIDGASSRIQYMNRALSDLIGYSLDDFMSNSPQSYRQVLDQDYQQLADLIKQTVDTEGIWRGPVKVWRKDGVSLELGLTISHVQGTDDRPAGSVILARDIGPEKALQAQKDRFIASAAHELRTPVTNLKLRVYLAQREPDKYREHLAVLENTTNYIANLVESLLEVSRFERGTITLQREPAVLQDVLAMAVNECLLLADQKHIQLINEMALEPLYVSIDVNRIRQAADNLIINAINYTPEGGQVRVQAFAEQAGETSCAVFGVHDTGVGISPEHMPRLFEPFFRVGGSKVKGMGLGLTITKEIVELHGGAIAAGSVLDEGSIFTVRLPLEPA